MMKFVTVAYLCLLIGQTVCDLECYKCWDCKENEENWDTCTEDSTPSDSSESTTTTITSTISLPSTTSTTTITPTITPPPSPSPTTTTPPPTTTTTTTSTTTVPSHSSETSAESSTISETTTPNISNSSTITTTTLKHEKPDVRTRTTTSLPIFQMISRNNAKVDTKQHKCAFIKYKDDNDNDITDRFCTMKENCENIGKTSYADTKIICKVCESNLCNKDEPGGGRTIHSGTFATVLVLAISKTLLFN